MATRADFRCIDCKVVHADKFFDGTPPGSISVECCNESGTSEARRVWAPVAIGRVEGAGGSPARG